LGIGLVVDNWDDISRWFNNGSGSGQNPTIPWSDPRGQEIHGIWGRRVGDINVLFGKSRPGNNQKQNEQFEAVMKSLGIRSPADPRWRRTHDAIDRNEKMNFQELSEFVREFLGIVNGR